MKILFSCDHRFLPGLEITVASLAASSADPGPIEIFVAGHDIPPAAWRAVQQRLTAFDRRLLVRAIDPAFGLWDGVQAQVPPGLGYLAWISAVEANFSSDRVLALDADLIIMRDVAELAALDLRGGAIGACRDVREIIAADCPDPELVRTHGGRPYLNSGLLVIDAAAWHRQRLFAQARDFACRWGESIGFRDQPVINAVLRGAFVELGWAWNVSHEHAGWIDAPEPPVDRFESTVLHVWKQWKPWTALNFAWSGAVWYGLAAAYNASEDKFDYRCVPRARQTIWKRQHPRIIALAHQCRGHADVAAFWRERHRELPGDKWARYFPGAVEACRAWWQRRLDARPSSAR